MVKLEIDRFKEIFAAVGHGVGAGEIAIAHGEAEGLGAGDILRADPVGGRGTALAGSGADGGHGRVGGLRAAAAGSQHEEGQREQEEAMAEEAAAERHDGVELLVGR